MDWPPDLETFTDRSELKNDAGCTKNQVWRPVLGPIRATSMSGWGPAWISSGCLGFGIILMQSSKEKIMRMVCAWTVREFVNPRSSIIARDNISCVSVHGPLGKSPRWRALHVPLVAPAFGRGRREKTAPSVVKCVIALCRFPEISQQRFRESFVPEVTV